MSIKQHETLSSKKVDFLYLKTYYYIHIYTRAPRGSGSASAKRVSDALKNDTKANIQENFPGKVQFEIKWVAWPLWSPPLVGGPIYTHTHEHTNRYTNRYTYGHVHIICHSSQIVLFEIMFESI